LRIKEQGMHLTLNKHDDDDICGQVVKKYSTYFPSLALQPDSGCHHLIYPSALVPICGTSGITYQFS